MLSGHPVGAIITTNISHYMLVISLRGTQSHNSLSTTEPNEQCTTHSIT